MLSKRMAEAGMRLDWVRDQSSDLHAGVKGGPAMVSWQPPEKSGSNNYYRVEWNDGKLTTGETVDEDDAIRICERLIAERTC